MTRNSVTIKVRKFNMERIPEGVGLYRYTSGVDCVTAELSLVEHNARQIGTAVEEAPEKQPWVLMKPRLGWSVPTSLLADPPPESRGHPLPPCIID